MNYKILDDGFIKPEQAWVDSNISTATVSMVASVAAAPSFAIVDDPSGMFEISGDQLKVKDGMSLDFDSQPSHQILLEATDEFGATYQETVTVDVRPVALETTESKMPVAVLATILLIKVGLALLVIWMPMPVGLVPP